MSQVVPALPVLGEARPSRRLVAAALLGLAAATACGDPAPRSGVLSDVVDESITLEGFSTECDGRGGYVQTHPHCGGANLCKGMSYDTGTHHLTEHTCKGLNTCAGMSCVVLPQDSGVHAEAFYAQACSTCHGGGGSSKFVLPVALGADAAQAEAAFQARSAHELELLVAFGSSSGVGLGSHPASYEQHSRAEYSPRGRARAWARDSGRVHALVARSMSPQRTKGRLAAACAPLILLAACAWGEALDSNPSAWHPAEVKIESPLPQPSADEAGAEPAPAADCTGTPPHQRGLRRSASEGLSHRASEPCLAGCHEPGGTAQLAFAAAGSAYTAQGVRIAASPGNLVRGVGGTELEVDACGNFYAIADALTTNVRNTQPWVKGASFHRMEKPLAKNARAGDCNQSGCHDFSGRLNSGIYY